MKTIIALFASLIFSAIAPAAEWATNFNLPAVNGSVLAIAETPEAFYYGGTFTQVGRVAANNIVRVDKATGAITPLGSSTQNGTGGFLPTSPADVRAIAVIGTDLYVAGSFNKVSSSTQNAITANLIAKWSTTTNTWSPLGSASQNGTAGGIKALAVSGTDLYVGGQFSTMKSSTQSGISAKNVAKWDTLTGLWSPLGSASQNGVSSGSAVEALAVSGQDLYVGGTFSNVSSSTQAAISANYIAKWDMAGSTWSPLGSAAQNGTSTIVDVLAVNGTDIYAGGSFTTVSSSTQNAISAKGVAKWDSDDQVWVPLGTGTQNGVSGSVDSLAVSGTSLYVGGIFYEVYSATQSSFAVNDIACWDMVAGTWSALGEGLQLGTGWVEALAVSGSDVHAGGTFREIGGILNTSGIGKWNITASSWGPAVPVVPGDGIIGTVGTVNTVVDAGSVVYVGGSFTYAGSVAANNIACWNKATRTWSALGSVAQNGTGGGVEEMVLIGTDLYVGGSFTTVSSSSQNGVSARNIAKWDTINGVWSPLGSASQNGASAFSFVSALAVIGGDLYVGGSFTSVSSSTQNGISAKGIARWSLAQQTWSPLGTGTQNGTGGLGGTVYGLAVSGNDLYVGGFFSTVSSSTQNGISANNVAKWSTETSEWSPMGSAAQNGTNNTVKSLAAKGGGIYVGGNFLTVSSSTQSSISARRVARWDVAGSTWAPLGSASQNGTASNVEALLMRSSDLYVAGGFTTVSSATQNAISAKHVARWSETSGTWAQLGTAAQNGADSTAYTLALSGSDLYVGGSFDAVSSDTQNAIASVGVGIYGPVPTPDISVEQPAGTPLTDGTASISFGGVVTGSNGAPVTFTIKNPGTTDLTLATISKDGANPGDFTVNATGMPTTLAPGGSTTFTVIFNPTADGARGAALHIASDVAGSKNPFDIALTGTGTSDIADLSGLTLSEGNLDPAFDVGTTAYSAIVANAVSFLTVSPTRAQANATIEARVNGGSYSPVTSGNPSGALALNVGSNTINIRVTAQAGNTKTYTITVTRDKASQTITFANPGDQLTTATLNLSATGGGSGNPVTFAVTNGPGSISGGNVLTFSGAGSVTIAASQAGNANYYDATPVARTFTVTKATATVTLNSLAQTYDGSPKPVGATTSPLGKTVTFTYDGSTTAPTNAGSYAVVGTIGDSIYQGSANGALVIAKAAQAITFANPGTQFSTATVNLSATGGASGNPVTFAVTSGPATIANDTTLSFTGTGSVTITASQAGNGNYAAATPVARTFTVVAPPEITVSGNGQPIVQGDANPSTGDHTDFGSVALTGATLARTFTVTNSGTGVLLIPGTPKVEITGTHAADFTVTADPVSPVDPEGGTTTFTITFNPSAAGVRTATVSLATNDPDENPATFAIQGNGQPSANADLSALTVSEGTLDPVFAAATTSYAASVAGPSITVTPTVAQVNATVQVRVNGGSYAPVTSGSPSGSLALNVGSNTIEVRVTAEDTTTTRSYTLTVTRDKASQAITFSNPGDQSATATVNLSAAGGASGNPVTFAVTSGPASLSGNVLSFTGAGSVTITASQAGNSEYHAATPVARTFNVSLVPQMITFTSPGSRFISEILTLAATGGGSSSGLSYEVLAGPGLIANGNELSFTGGGSVTIRASQAGDDLHSAADPVDQTFEVILPKPDVAVGLSPFALVGVDVYAPSGQLVTLTSRRAVPVTGHVGLGNRVVLPDNRAADAVVLRGSGGNALFKVAYLTTTEGNVTAGILTGTYQTAAIDGDDGSVLLSATITPNKRKLAIKKGSRTVYLKKSFTSLFQASSKAWPAATDAASIKVQTN